MPLGSIGELKVEQQIDTIVAYKHGEILRFGEMDYRLGGFRDTYGVDATAKCHSLRSGVFDREHKAPKLDCECGFYAVPQKYPALTSPVFEVELYGTVIEHERGYRAEKQRVLRVSLPCCDTCRRNAATHMTFGQPTSFAYQKYVKGAGGIGFHCAEHAEEGYRKIVNLASEMGPTFNSWDFKLVPLDEVRAGLNTEVISEPRR